MGRRRGVYFLCTPVPGKTIAFIILHILFLLVGSGHPSLFYFPTGFIFPPAANNSSSVQWHANGLYRLHHDFRQMAKFPQKELAL